MATLGDVLVVDTKQDEPLNANAPGGAAGAAVSNFVTIQSLATFAVAVPVLKTIWELLKAAAGGWADSYWTPMLIAGVYAAWQLSISIFGDNRVKGTGVISAFVIALANTGILASSIIGLTETTGVGEG